MFLLCIGLQTQMLAQTYSDSKPISISIINTNAPIHELPPEVYIKSYVEKRVNEWQIKDEFEKTVDWQKRVNEQTRKTKALEWQIEAETIYKKAYAENINWKQFSVSTYDADNETFLITSNNFGQFALSVSINFAKKFKENFAQVKVSNPQFGIAPDKVHLLKLDFYNPADNQTFVYNSKEASRYAVADITYNFSDLDIEISNQASNNTNISTNKIIAGKPEVDVNIPTNPTNQTNTFAVIIANENYKREVKVEYALNDGAVFKEYCLKTLGIPAQNIHYASDATFGSMKSEIKWISEVAAAYKGEAKLIFYYAGHGMPNETTKEAYLLPTDGFSSDFETAIRLEELYTKLNENPSKSITVFLDACFSGSIRDNGMLASARSVVVKPKQALLASNMVVFSATTDDETAYPYHEKQHGLFTYFLLKKLQDTKGNLSYSELSEYISNNVKKQSVVVNQKSQSPQVNVGNKVADTWKQFKFRE